MSNCVPCIVKALGEQVGLTPLDWWEYPDRVVITFVQGPKLTFIRDVEAEPTKAPEPVKPKRKQKSKGGGVSASSAASPPLLDGVTPPHD
jgi:hypothetical protein